MGKLKNAFRRFLGFEEETAEELATMRFEEDLRLQKEQDVQSEQRHHHQHVVQPEVTQTPYERIEPGTQEEIVLYPKTYADASIVVDRIAQGYVVVMDLETVDIETCKRISDFVL